LYTGVTNDLEQRIIEHYSQRGRKTSFTGRYYTYYLLYNNEAHKYINSAIAREKEIKAWRREKMALIASFNPSLMKI